MLFIIDNSDGVSSPVKFNQTVELKDEEKINSRCWMTRVAVLFDRRSELLLVKYWLRRVAIRYSWSNESSPSFDRFGVFRVDCR